MHLCTNCRKSMDIHGNMEGGGVCEECRDHTTGINCQTCEVPFKYHHLNFSYIIQIKIFHKKNHATFRIFYCIG